MILLDKILNFKQKLKAYTWAKLVKFLRSHKYYPYIYKSYWHYRFYKTPHLKNQESNYFTAVPNRGAGIGHQIANWIAGYWYAKQFGLHFAHIPFSTNKWESFLGFGVNEISVEKLINKKGYQKVLLPLFTETNKKEVQLIKKIIASYNNKVVFVAEQDQYYKDQFGVIEDIKQKFYAANHQKKEHLTYSNNNFNIAIHVRRGDIVIGQETKNPNLLMRWQNNDYFVNVLSNVIENLKTQKPITIYLFSQGKPADFKEFDQFKNINFCLEMSAEDSFLHMVYADLLITSKSSFSYKPALLNNGIKVCPSNFWHGYPTTKDWILANDNGMLSIKKHTNE